MDHVHLLKIPVVEGLRKNGSGRVLWCLVSTSVQGGPRATAAIYYLHARFVEPRVLRHKDLETHGLPPAEPNVTPLLANMFRWSPIMPCEGNRLLLSKEISLALAERTLACFSHFRRLRLCYECWGEHFQAFHELAAALLICARIKSLGLPF
jgi:hypothetical protein